MSGELMVRATVKKFGVYFDTVLEYRNYYVSDQYSRVEDIENGDLRYDIVYFSKKFLNNKEIGSYDTVYFNVQDRKFFQNYDFGQSNAGCIAITRFMNIHYGELDFVLKKIADAVSAVEGELEIINAS